MVMVWWMYLTVSKFEQTIIIMIVKWWWLYLTQLSWSMDWCVVVRHEMAGPGPHTTTITTTSPVKVGIWGPQPVCCHCRLIMTHHHHHHHKPTNITCTTHFLGLSFQILVKILHVTRENVSYDYEDFPSCLMMFQYKNNKNILLKEDWLVMCLLSTTLIHLDILLV